MNPGRKRAFDEEEVLDKAMRVFWENGYSGTSMSDLTSAMGINKPSLYSAFGTKEQLFAAALEHYLSKYGAPLLVRLTAPTEGPLRQRLRAYMLGIVDLVSGKASPKGCLFVKSCCESGGTAVPEGIATSLQDLGLANEKVLADLLKAEQRRGGLSPDIRPKDMAGYLLSVIYGLSVLARRGKPRDELKAVVDTALTALGWADRKASTRR